MISENIKLDLANDELFRLTFEMVDFDPDNDEFSIENVVAQMQIPLDCRLSELTFLTECFDIFDGDDIIMLNCTASDFEVELLTEGMFNIKGDIGEAVYDNVVEMYSKAYTNYNSTK